MINWLKLLFHIHKWKTITCGEYIEDDNSVIGNWYDSRCSICGKIKRFET